MKNKLGIVAGGGEFPGLAIAACRAQGRPFHVLALEGHADPRVIGDSPADWIRLGEAGTGLKILRDQGVVDLVMIGGVRRPGWRELTPDWWSARFLAKLGLKALGDDGLLRALAAALEDEGFHVVGIDDVLSDCLATDGPYGRIAPDERDWTDIRLGWTVAKGLGALDVGQAVVVQQGLILGVEAIEGTDALIRRTADLRRDGPGPILVKCRKPSQDRRLDLPTLGVATLREASASGFRGVAVEAGGVLVMGRGALAEEADRLGLFLFGATGPC